MILTGRDIAWYIETKKLVIDPIVPEQFQQNGVDLILENVNRYTMIGQDPMFQALKFYLGGTRERIQMPDDLMAFVELRSTWARSGLILPPTIVDAGFSGNLTLEIFAVTDCPIPFGQRFAHLIFAKLTGPSIAYNGKYQHQSGVTGPRPDR